MTVSVGLFSYIFITMACIAFKSQKHIATGSDKQSCYECNNSMICLTYKEVVYDLVDNLMITRGILKRSELLSIIIVRIDGLHANLDR